MREKIATGVKRNMYRLFRFRAKASTLGVNHTYIFHPQMVLLRQISCRVL
jgi:hypothetical protein